MHTNIRNISEIFHFHLYTKILKIQKFKYIFIVLEIILKEHCCSHRTIPINFSTMLQAKFVSTKKLYSVSNPSLTETQSKGDHERRREIHGYPIYQCLRRDAAQVERRRFRQRRGMRSRCVILRFGAPLIDKHQSLNPTFP